MEMKPTPKVNLTVPVDPDLREDLRNEASLDDRQMADFVRVAIRERIARKRAERERNQPALAQAGQA